VEPPSQVIFFTNRFTLTGFTFQNQTSGLFGNWSHDITDEFILPSGLMGGAGTSINNFESIHRDFALQCEYIVVMLLFVTYSAIIFKL
jgi:hypothetical protein